LRRAAGRLGRSEDAVAIAWVLAQPWVDLVLSGAATAEQLRSNLAAMRIGPAVTLARELDELAEPSDRYWSKRSELNWN
jgi:aryl-alcohol dehydrogenase-like predicted oxidoreductase